MNCDACREILSARLDGEDNSLDSQLDDQAVDAHLRECAGCQAYQGAAWDLHRSVRVRPAEWGPDLTGRILARIGEEVQPPAPSPRADRRRDLRVALVVVAILQVAFALPLLLAGGQGEVAHAHRELASFDVALAVGFLVCAWQPVRVPGLLPVAGALAAFLAVTAGFDLVSGRTALAAESVHLMEATGVLLLWLLGRTGATSTGGNRPGPASGSGSGRPVTSR